MQGQRGVIGSLPETLDFDHGSASGNPIMDQQLCWNNLRTPSEERLSNFMLSPVQMNTYANPIDHERQNLNRWSLGEPSSGSARTDRSRDKQKMEHGSSSSSAAAAASMSADPSSRLEERRHEPTHMLSLNSVDVNAQFVHSSNANGFPQNLNLNAGLVGQGDDSMGGHNMIYKSSGAEHAVSGSEDFLLPSGSGGYLREDDGRPGCSLDGRRQSCKRKAVEGHGQSSMSGGSSLFQHPEGSGAWPGVPPRQVSSSLSISAAAPPEQHVHPRLVLGMRGLGTEGLADPMPSGGSSRQRNFRLRINPSHQESVPSSLFSSGGIVRHHSSRHNIPVENSLEFRSSPSAAEAPISQVQPAVIPVTALPHNVPPFRWSETSGSRPGSSSGGPIDLSDREEGSSRNTARQLWEHPMFVPATEPRTSARNQGNRNNIAGGNISVPSSNFASSAASRSGGSSSGVHLSAPTWVPHQNSSRNSRRLAEYVRRSLFSSDAAGGDPGTQSSNNNNSSAAAEMVIPAGTSSSQGHHHRPHPRSAPWLDRLGGDGVLRIPYPLRTFSASGEGRSRLVSEIRNVLDLMRRGEGLRFEDVMILDQSVMFGVADIHDRHRDMRLDVDNMSYEELLALEEQIGSVNTGLSEEAIVDRLKQRKYSAAVESTTEGETEPCCVCQEEYNNGEEIGTLDCGHDFHTGCVKQWLMLKNWCPICKTTGLAPHK